MNGYMNCMMLSSTYPGLPNDASIMPWYDRRPARWPHLIIITNE